MSFATAINCMDGRVQIPVIDYIKRRYKVAYVDVITEPGPNGILAKNLDGEQVGSIRKRVEISISRHNSAVVAVVGHYDCAGNPVNEETQIEQIKAAIKTVESWGMGVQIIGLWVNENWEVCEVN